MYSGSSDPRGRNEIRYDTGVIAGKVEYSWKMKIASDFSVTNIFEYNFCHLHQLKYKDGPYSGQPMFTITAHSSGNSEYFSVISSETDYNGDHYVKQEPLANFKGKWLQITEIVDYTVGTNAGKYGVLIIDFENGDTLMKFADNSISTYKIGGASATEIQQKWGIYRTKHNDLQDESVLFNDFEVKYLDDNDPIDFEPEQIEETSSINDNESLIDINLEIFPNPIESFVTVKIEYKENSQDMTLILTDIFGKQVLNVKYASNGVKNSINQFDLSEIPSGVYILNISINDKAAYSKKLVKI